MTDYTELERLAYINGQPELAEMYDRAAMIEDIDTEVLIELAKTGLDEIKETEYYRGYEEGKCEASDVELLQKVTGLHREMETLDAAYRAMHTSYSVFLKWLQTDAAKTITARRQAIRTQELALITWRRTAPTV